MRLGASGSSAATMDYTSSFFPPGSLSVPVSDPNKQLVVRGQSGQVQSTELVPLPSEGRPLSSRSIDSAAKAPVVTSEETLDAAMDHLIDLAINSRALKAERDLLAKDNTLLKSQIEQLKTTLDASWTAHTTSIAAKVNTLYLELIQLSRTVFQAHHQTSVNLQAWHTSCAHINAQNAPTIAWNQIAFAWAGEDPQPLLPLPAAPCAVSGVTPTVYSYCTNSITPLIEEINKLQAALPNLPAQARKEAQETWKPSEASLSEPSAEERALVPLADESPVSGAFEEVVRKKELRLEEGNALVRNEILLFEKEKQQLNAEKTMLQKVDEQAWAIYKRRVKELLTLPNERAEQNLIRTNYNLLYQSGSPIITPKLDEIMTLIKEILK